MACTAKRESKNIYNDFVQTLKHDLELSDSDSPTRKKSVNSSQTDPLPTPVKKTRI